jgi:hypothetical protein
MMAKAIMLITAIFFPDVPPETAGAAAVGADGVLGVDIWVLPYILDRRRPGMFPAAFSLA